MQSIQHAIDGRLCLAIVYGPGTRLVEPFVLGKSKDGSPLLRAYQIDGASESGEPVGWRLFRVDRIEAATLTDIPFIGDRPDYNPNDKAMKGGISARVL